MQLAEQANHLVLGRRLVAGVFVGDLPQLVDAALAVHQADEAVGGGGEAMRAPADVVLQDEPDLAAILVAMNLGVRAQARLEIRRRDTRTG